MKNENVPALDARYWAAIIAASLLGTTFGDFISNDLGLGFAGALLPLAAILAVIFVAEHLTTWTSVVYYWVAIVFTRTAATNLGDFLARSLHLGYGSVSAVVAVLLAAFLIVTRRRASRSDAPVPGATIARKVLPRTDARYWVGILMVSTLGTTFGDFVANDLGYGLGLGSLVLAALLVTVLIVEFTAEVSNEARYWVIIAVVRTTGTVMGDFLSSSEGLNLGFAAAAGMVGALLVTILLFPSPLPDEAKEVASVE